MNGDHSFACVYCFQINTGSIRHRHRSDNQGSNHRQSTPSIKNKNEDQYPRKRSLLACPSIRLPSNTSVIASKKKISTNRLFSIIDSAVYASHSWLLSFIAIRIQILRAIRPLLTVHTLLFLVTSGCYWNAAFAPGEFVHDDLVAVARNPDVLGENELYKLFSNDFWGEPMHHETSHKSYRPFTVLTFR